MTALEERRRLVLMVRETPLHLGHLRSMVQLTEMGAVIAPPLPAFYAAPQTLAEVVDQSVGRALDLVRPCSWRAGEAVGRRIWVPIMAAGQQSRRGPLALWPYALEVGGLGPGSRRPCLELQGTSTAGARPILRFWSLWLAASGRPASPATCCRSRRSSWRGPGRTPPWAAADPPARPRPPQGRHCPGGAGARITADQGRGALGAGGRADAAADTCRRPGPAPAPALVDPLAGLEAAVRVWGGAAPAALLQRLATAA